jgi:hypothetical protein
MAAKRKGKKPVKGSSAFSGTVARAAPSPLRVKKKAPPFPPVAVSAAKPTPDGPVASQRPLLSPHPPFSREIPFLYNETYLRVMPRDEGRVFSFWEMAPEAIRKVKKEHTDFSKGSSTGLLRIYEVRQSRHGRAGRVFVDDVPVRKGVHSQYLSIPHGGRTYRVELGVRLKSGKFVAVCGSDEVRMPDARLHDTAPDRNFNADTGALTAISLRGAVLPADPGKRRRPDAGEVSDVDPLIGGSPPVAAHSPVKPWPDASRDSGKHQTR